MSGVIRVVVLYLVLLALFRLCGRRTLGEATTFDLLLVLIISETTQQAMVGDDHSFTHAVVLICTLLGCDIALSLVKHRWKAMDRLIDGGPVTLVEGGAPVREAMDATRTDEAEILEAARLSRGIDRLDRVERAVLERTGKISIIGKRRAQR